MTLDPVDQCTFYYTNEYLKTNGAFNWSTRVASYKFSSCTSAASLWGTITGTITSCATGATISGVTVTLSNGFAGASDANGNYSILAPAGTYTATATDTDRNCASSTPSSRSEEHTSELQSPYDLVCRLLLEKKKKKKYTILQGNHNATESLHELTQNQTAKHHFLRYLSHYHQH